MTTQTANKDAQYVQEWHEWRAGWEQFLVQPYGWLAATSFNWVENVQQQYPGLPGLWRQEGRRLYVDPQGQKMSYDGESFTSVRSWDLSEAPDDTRITAGDMQIGITYREQYLLVKYDPQAPARTGFHGVPTYGPDPCWILTGRLETHAAPEPVSFQTVGTGDYTYTSRGVIRFSHAGSERYRSPLVRVSGRRRG